MKTSIYYTENYKKYRKIVGLESYFRHGMRYMTEIQKALTHTRKTLKIKLSQPDNIWQNASHNIKHTQK